MSQSTFTLRRMSVLSMALGALSVLACASQDAARPTDEPGHTRQPLSPTPDGDKTIATATQVNSYAKLTAAAAANATSITVDATQLTAMGLKPGDLVMIIQMQGAGIDTTDGATYGKIQNLQGAGAYELVTVASVDINTGIVGINGLCNGLKNSYSATAGSQIVRVPQYGTLVVNPSGLITGQPWDGSTGGVVAIRARHVTLNGTGEIRATGIGFRGGAPQGAGNPASDISTYVSSTNTDGGGKGEGVAGLSGLFARGASANGGGGGNSYGAGGGGGGNGGDPATWSGQGVMVVPMALPKFLDAWKLDPAYIAGNALTNSPGGGRGGYTQATTNQDATLVGPASTTPSWGGNLRRPYGGAGGVPVPNDPTKHLFLGGGGGAGAPAGAVVPMIIPSGGGGGGGGGLVYLLATKVDGDGRITADGTDGSTSTAPTANGGGGGGAGGTIVVNTPSLSGTLTLHANGGQGGSQLDPNSVLTEAEGPGGGGSGGYIAVPTGTPTTVAQQALGGASGTTESQLVTEFPPNGATYGRDGLTGQALNPQNGQTPICAPVDLRVSVTDAQSQAAPGARQTFIVTVYNDGPFTATGATLAGTVTPAVTGTDWICTATSPNQDVDPATCGTVQGTGLLSTSLVLPPGSNATILVHVPIAADATGTLQYSATITPPPDVTDIDLTNNTGTDTTGVGPAADLAMRATAAPTPTTTGQPITFILSTYNNGPNPATNVTVTFDIPPMTTVVGTPVGDGWTCNVDQTQRLMTCVLQGTLDRGAAPDITVTVNPDFGDTSVLGSSKVSSDNFDPDQTNNSATAVATINFDPATYKQPSLAGGGFGCSQAPGGSPSSVALGSLLAAAVLLLRRRRERTAA